MHTDHTPEGDRRTNWLRFIFQEEATLFHIMEDLGTNDVFISQHEGTSYTRELFDAMYRIFQKHYHFHFSEPKIAREEVYFSTIARALSKDYSNPVIYLGRCPQPLDPNLDLIGAVESIRATGYVEASQPLRKENPEFGKRFFGIKIFRDNARVRQHISSLPAPA